MKLLPEAARGVNTSGDHDVTAIVGCMECIHSIVGCLILWKMATPARVAVRKVRPVLSLTKNDARRRVLNLYRAWYRQIPYIAFEYDIPVTEDVMRNKLRELFYKNKDVKDIRAIDILVIKGQMELQETEQKWKNSGTFMNYFRETEEKKPTNFLSKFLAGQD